MSLEQEAVKLSAIRLFEICNPSHKLSADSSSLPDECTCGQASVSTSRYCIKKHSARESEASGG